VAPTKRATARPIKANRRDCGVIQFTVVSLSSAREEKTFAPQAHKREHEEEAHRRISAVRERPCVPVRNLSFDGSNATRTIHITPARRHRDVLEHLFLETVQGEEQSS